MTPNFLAITAHMIAEVQSRGQTPMLFSMNRATKAHVAREIMEFRKQKMSALGRAWHWIRNRNAEPVLQILHGLPVMENPQLQDGAIFLQSAPPQMPQGMGSPSNMEQAARAAAQENQQRGSEFWRKEPVAPAAEDAAPTLNDLASGNGERPTASAVLIKALESSEDLAGIVVIRVHSNRDIDMTMNVDPLACRGILDKAAQYLFMKGM